MLLSAISLKGEKVTSEARLTDPETILQPWPQSARPAIRQSILEFISDGQETRLLRLDSPEGSMTMLIPEKWSFDPTLRKSQPNSIRFKHSQNPKIGFALTLMDYEEWLGDHSESNLPGFIAWLNKVHKDTPIQYNLEKPSYFKLDGPAMILDTQYQIMEYSSINSQNGEKTRYWEILVTTQKYLTVISFEAPEKYFDQINESIMPKIFSLSWLDSMP